MENPKKENKPKIESDPKMSELLKVRRDLKSEFKQKNEINDKAISQRSKELASKKIKSVHAKGRRFG